MKLIAAIIAIIVLVIILASCGGKQSIKTVTEYIDRPVYCASPVASPEYATESISSEDTIDIKVKALLQEIAEREVTEIKLKAELQGCLNPENSLEELN